MSKTQYEMVREFTKAMGQPLDVPLVAGETWSQWVTPEGYTEETFGDLLTLRSDLLYEEWSEVTNSQSLENLVKELCDLVYVICGLCATFGIDFDEAFKRVHESNMSKLGDDGKPMYRDDGKILKGLNYKEPDLSDLL